MRYFFFAVFTLPCFCCAQNVDTLLDAIRMVESSGGVFLHGKNGELGPYQIKKIVIDDVNRILGKGVYKYEDSMNEKKSREICRIYVTYWASKSGESSLKRMARIWNGGPSGYKKESTKKYWIKIEGAMKCQ